MASLTLGSVVYNSSKFVSRLARTSPNLYYASGRRAIQASSHPETSAGADAADAVKPGADDPLAAGENISSRAAHTAHSPTDRVAENAKKTAESAWGAAKDTAQRAKEKVIGKAQEASETVKATAAEVERSMNTKN